MIVRLTIIVIKISINYGSHERSASPRKAAPISQLAYGPGSSSTAKIANVVDRGKEGRRGKKEDKARENYTSRHQS